MLLLEGTDDGAFCAGSDLREIAELAGNAAARPEFRKAMRDAMDGFGRLSIPSVAAIDGDCFGAGVALALACDIRVAGENARFAITPAKLGIAYPQEDVERVVRAVGRGQAARLFFAAEPVDAVEAARIGLVEIATVSARMEAVRIATLMAGNARTSLAVLKEMIWSDLSSPAPAYDAAFDDCFGGQDFLEGLAAFRDRRRPTFA